MNQKRDALLAEVSYLLMIKSQEYEYQQDSVQSQNPNLQSKLAKPKSLAINGAGFHEEGIGRNQGNVQAQLRKEKKPKNCLSNGKRVGKKKITWQDPVALKV
ncbi:putative Pentatricopeptide repeat-containing protein [Hibiscus syriacus]|uniref:Pentatricopeptide repeat-containing protein n=1 Tax=Hibiscus syriacus TaxID=106335 RepID=A0A6A2X876_HIBSY|nr:putative Pentatricopeptide repeat-containing protein [Hibiscus syriacus]